MTISSVATMSFLQGTWHALPGPYGELWWTGQHCLVANTGDGLFSGPNHNATDPDGNPGWCLLFLLQKLGVQECPGPRSFTHVAVFPEFHSYNHLQKGSCAQGPTNIWCCLTFFLMITITWSIDICCSISMQLTMIIFRCFWRYLKFNFKILWNCQRIIYEYLSTDMGVP